MHCNNIVKFTGMDSDGNTTSEFSAHNLLTYAAATAMINGILQSGPSQPTWLYARFGSLSETAYLTNPDLRTVSRSSFLASGDGVVGGLWVPLFAPPQQVTSDNSLYAGNQANFPFRIPANISSTQVSPSGNFNVSTSYIYAVGLAVAASSTDRTQDIIVSCLQNFTPFQIPSGGQYALSYPWQILITPAS